jgi:hypothetical protein
MAIDAKGLSKLLTLVSDEEAAKIIEAGTAAHAHRYARATRAKTVQGTDENLMEDEGNLDGRNKP